MEEVRGSNPLSSTKVFGGQSCPWGDNNECIASPVLRAGDLLFGQHLAMDVGGNESGEQLIERLVVVDSDRALAGQLVLIDINLVKNAWLNRRRMLSSASR